MDLNVTELDKKVEQDLLNKKVCYRCKGEGEIISGEQCVVCLGAGEIYIEPENKKTTD